LNSKAVTKIQAIILAATIIIAGVIGSAVYVFWLQEPEQIQAIKIGVCADIDNFMGKAIWQGAILAAEQVNAEGGVLGRKIEIAAEDDDSETTQDAVVATNAFNKLVTVDKADFVMTSPSSSALMYQELAAQHKKILFSPGSSGDEAAQRVLDDYDKYKYFFGSMVNSTMGLMGTVQSFVDCMEYTGFNKIGFIYENTAGSGGFVSIVIDFLTANGFEIVYTAEVPLDTVDFSSYFAQAEAAGAEIVYPLIYGAGGIPFVKEYYDRQSPTILWGFIIMAQLSNFWAVTEGRCEHTTNNGYPIVAGYPYTNKTLPTREAYFEMWSEEITSSAATAYDIVRFILPDSIERAGTLETEDLIEALEIVNIETSVKRHFEFTSSHEIMVRGWESVLVCMFQWQDGVQVPVWPKQIMEEAGATYMFPDWPGPWDNLD
jgi:branched-chain amino acid transport system substrate-binding protein